LIEQGLKKQKTFNNGETQILTRKFTSGINWPVLIRQPLKKHKKTLVKKIIIFYLITVAPLVIIDGRLTVLGIEKGYYQGELNPLINYLFSYFSVDAVFMLRAIFIVMAVAFLAFIYFKYPSYIRKYYLLLTITLIAYLAINIIHVWAFISAVL